MGKKNKIRILVKQPENGKRSLITAMGLSEIPAKLGNIMIIVSSNLKI